ncbi:hypothetical protein NMY22_g8121 [Coprinellus aureogranulatus]|nr:hypothetical protein NMY22_g8121 [Coprinellus aureogranulatus]
MPSQEETCEDPRLPISNQALQRERGRVEVEGMRIPTGFPPPKAGGEERSKPLSTPPWANLLGRQKERSLKTLLPDVWGKMGFCEIAEGIGALAPPRRRPASIASCCRDGEPKDYFKLMDDPALSEISADT